MALALATAACTAPAIVDGDGGGGASGRVDAGHRGATSAAGAACLPCASVVGDLGTLEAVPRLCPSSAALWKTLHACACELGGDCLARCTEPFDDAGASWCSALAGDPVCYGCLASTPVGCGDAYAACAADR